MPGPAGIREEIQIQLRTQAYLDTVDEYLHQNCDKRGVSECSEVLTPKEKAGLDEIRDGITNRGWMIYCTDKSGKIVLDTKENFLNCMRDHYSSDKIVTPDEVRESEKHINDHVRSWVKTFNIGNEAGCGQATRCNRALINNYATIPSLQGLRKDHKGDIENDPIIGP